MMRWISRHVSYPLWELKDRSIRLRELRELEQSQWLPTETLRTRQERRLAAQLDHAFRHNAFYRARLLSVGYDPHEPPREVLARLPFLTKREIQDDPKRLIAEDVAESALVIARTGGSTGTSLTVYFDERCQQKRNAAAFRSDRWGGWDLGMMTASVWGNPPAADTLKKKLRRLLLDRTFYLDTMHLDEAAFEDFVHDWRRLRPEFIFGHAHSVFVLARHLEQHGITDLRPRGVIATSMMLLPRERRAIERVFGCRVTNRYGCEEVGLIACECEQGGMHVNIDHLLVEIVKPDGRPAEVGEEGEVVVTDLINRGMPLLRYRVGDLAVAGQSHCACGRGLPLIEKLTGRTADFLKRTDGSLVAGVSLVERTLTAIDGIDQMQLVQAERGTVTVYLVAGRDYSAASVRQLRSALQSALGADMKIDVRKVAGIPQEASGKFRFAKCSI